jgi:hypothetical protein
MSFPVLSEILTTNKSKIKQEVLAVTLYINMAQVSKNFPGAVSPS